MSEIPVLLAAYLCTPDAVICTDVSRHIEYLDPLSCETAAVELRQQLRWEADEGSLIFTKCHFVLTERHYDGAHQFSQYDPVRQYALGTTQGTR